MKNINENELKKYIFKKLQESYFDDMEFDNDAMKAAMSDMEDSGEEFEELGASKFEKDPKFKEKFKSALNRANLELPSDEEEVERLAQMVKSRNDHEGRFGKGSLNEMEVEHIKDANGKPIKLGSPVQDENEMEVEHIKDANGKPIKLGSPVQDESGVVNGYVERFMVGDEKNMLVKVTWIQSPNVDKLNPIVSPEKLIVKENMMKMNEEAYEASRYMFFSNLEQVRRQAGLLLDLDENKINEILENGHDWAQDHIATAKESIDQVFDFLMNETQSGDSWKSVDLAAREYEEEEIEEGMGYSHTVGANTNEKPVNYPEELMREAVKDVLEGVFDKYTSTTATSGQFSKGGAFKKQSSLSTDLDKLSTWMGDTLIDKNKFIIKQEMPPKTIDAKDPNAKKPTVYIWIPTNNPNAINVEYRNITSAVNYVTTNKHIEKILKKFDKLGVLVQLMKGKDATQATFSLAMKAAESNPTATTAKPAATAGKPAATTTKPTLAESFMKEDAYHKLSFLDKIKLKLAGVSEEQALENLNNNLPIDWTGSVEGYYEKNEPRGNYSGTNEGIEEDMDKTDYDFNKAYLDHETEEEFNKEVYYVIDNDFNQKNYPDLVGKTFETPPSYAQVKVVKQGEMEESSSDSLLNKHGQNAKPNDMEESSSDSLINKRGTNSKPNASYLKEGMDNDRYEQVVFLQDHEADHALNILMQDGEEEAMDYLMQWHQVGNHETSEDVGFGSSDKTYERDGYTMAWNPSIGYISLVHDLNSAEKF